MLKVLVADDEANICLLIKNLVDWQGLGLEYIGEAHNGHEALARIRADKPDIVITDVKMPGMDGIELLKTVRENNGSGISFIIISGYKSFDYAYEAIKYGVVDFLLKPINRQELNAALQRLLLTTQGETGEARPEPMPERDQILRRQFLSNLLFSPDEPAGDIKTINHLYRCHFEEGLFLPCLLYVDHFDQLGKAKKPVMAQLTSLLLSQLQPLCFDIAVYQNERKLWFVLNYAETSGAPISEALRRLIGNMQEQLHAHPHLAVTIGAGQSGPLGQLAANIPTAQDAVTARTLLGGGQCLFYTDFEKETAPDMPKKVEPLHSAMKQAQEVFDKPAMLAACDACVDLLATQTAAPHIAMARFTHRVRIALLDIVQTHSRHLLVEYEVDSRLFQFEDCADIPELRRRFRQIVSDIYDRIESENASQDSKLLKTVKAYVEENYQNQITLEDVAGKVYLSASYFGTFFKKETGELFSQYLTRVRIGKAKELLKDYSYSIKEIADKVGYKDLRNFSRLFKNQVGVKPSEFRKLYRLDSGGG